MKIITKIASIIGGALDIIYLLFYAAKLGIQFGWALIVSFFGDQKKRADEAFWHWFYNRKPGTDWLSKWIERRTNNWLEIKYSPSRLDKFLPEILKTKPFDPENKEFDASEFAGYEAYDKANPNRFEVRYDENLNRIW